MVGLFYSKSRNRTRQFGKGSCVDDEYTIKGRGSTTHGNANISNATVSDIETLYFAADLDNSANGFVAWDELADN